MARRPKTRIPRPKQTKPQTSRSKIPPPVPRRHNLRTQLTSFIGREREIDEIKRLLGTTRLLTLTGTGGCGKTRLALRVADDLLNEAPDGVWVVDLAPVSNRAVVPQTVAAVLGIPEQPRRQLQQTLAASLRSRSLLLLLDNCEHLLGSCADLVNALLQGCPDLRILATSREPLGVAGEVRWTVPPLSPPNLQHQVSMDAVLRNDAVRLFVDRARAVRSEFAITENNAHTVADLCRRLDGIPLAIEMAAAWVRVLAVGEILGRLTDRFRLLTSGSRATLPRHQTLKTAMDWSYDLLPANERILLSRLSVFAGGWSLEAAETICSEGEVQRATIFDLLTHLVDKSLVIAETSGAGARYRLLETVRQYGEERLLESGKAADAHRRHRDWYLSFAEKANVALRESQQATWLQRLETEHDNLRAAIEWSKKERSGADAWLRLSAALHEFWFICGHYTEGRESLEGALTASIDSSAAVRALALSGAGLLAWRQGDASGSVYLHESLALFRKLNDQRGAAYALHHLAHFAEGEADFHQAIDMFEQSVSLYKQAQDTWGVGWSLYCLGTAMLLQGDHEKATPLLVDSLALCRAAGNRFTTAYALGGLAAVEALRGNYDRATVLIEEGLTLGQQIGSKNYIAWAKVGLANVALAQGHYDRAAMLFRESLAMLQELGNKRGLSESLEGLAVATSGQGDYLEAARLFGASDASRTRTGPNFWPGTRTDRDQRIATVRSALGSPAFATACAEGRAMTLEHAVEHALTPSARNQVRPHGRAKSPAVKRTGLLAPREREVATLVTEGMTNREIADRMSIREGTVEAHVQHILNKLGMNTRAQIAAWIVAHQRESAPPLD